MLMIDPPRCAARPIAAFALLLLSATVLPRLALGQSAGIDPQAEQLLKASMAYLGSQKQFSADTRSTIEVVLSSGRSFSSTTR